MQKGEWPRIVAAPLLHGSDLHLYYNMVSLLLKGRALERRFGSGFFFLMVLYFMVLTGLVYVALAYFTSALFKVDLFLLLFYYYWKKKLYHFSHITCFKLVMDSGTIFSPKRTRGKGDFEFLRNINIFLRCFFCHCPYFSLSLSLTT